MRLNLTAEAILDDVKALTPAERLRLAAHFIELAPARKTNDSKQRYLHTGYAIAEATLKEVGRELEDDEGARHNKAARP